MQGQGQPPHRMQCAVHCVRPSEPACIVAQEYCLNKDDLEFVLDVTKFKTKAPWGQDPYKDVPTQVKSAFTRRAPLGTVLCWALHGPLHSHCKRHAWLSVRLSSGPQAALVSMCPVLGVNSGMAGHTLEQRAGVPALAWAARAWGCAHVLCLVCQLGGR